MRFCWPENCCCSCSARCLTSVDFGGSANGSRTVCLHHSSKCLSSSCLAFTIILVFVLYMKRDLELDTTASGGDSANSAAEKRPRTNSLTSTQPSDVKIDLQCPRVASVQDHQIHPMAILEAIRLKLQNTVDPHLQGCLLLEYSTTAASPSANTAAAIDFLFSFLQQNQTQSTTLSEEKLSKDASSSGAIVVGAIVRGLRQLLAVKATVVEPMIQVNAMGEQLMQCLSVGEDFKLRRDMLRIVVDCLMCTKKYDQLKQLLHKCVHDHDAGMQAICLRTYLRLYNKGESFALETISTDDVAVSEFDLLTGFILFGQSHEVQVLASQVIVVLTELFPRCEATNSQYFPSTIAAKVTLLLPEKIFYVLCMAANDASKVVRAEVARCLRRMSCVQNSEVLEHAFVKTQVDEAVVDVATESSEMNTRRMMSSGVLLSLLEDVDEEVAIEASRTIARLGEVTARRTSTARWSQRVVERTITAHFDVLSRTSRSSTSLLRQVFVNSLSRLLVCRHVLGLRTDMTISSTELNFLLQSDTDVSLPAAIETLRVLQYYDLSSTWVVQRLVDYVSKIGTLFNSFEAKNDYTLLDCWKQRYFNAVQDLGKKCADVLKVDDSLLDPVRQETSQLHGRDDIMKQSCQALLCHNDFSNGINKKDSNLPSSDGTSLFFLQSPSTGSQTVDQASQVTKFLDALQDPPSDENLNESLNTICRLRNVFAAEETFHFVDVLVRLRKHLRSFPEVSTTLPSAPSKYVPISAMLSTSPSVSSEHTNIGSGEAEAFESLRIWNDLRKQCQELVYVASGVYVKAFALSLSPRIELLQLVMLGSIGLELASLQNSTDNLTIIAKLRWITKEATTRLHFLVEDGELKDKAWIPIEMLSGASTLNDLKRAFVAFVRKAWPTALIKSAITRCTPPTVGARIHFRRLATAHASIIEPISNVHLKFEPQEITANWAFEQRVNFVLTNTRDPTQVYVRSMLPDGEVDYHHVPLTCIYSRGPRNHSVVHTITLTVSPFSDPTAFQITVCLGHSKLPGIVKPSISSSVNAHSRMFTEISDPVCVPISHRTSTTLRHAATK
ncbi:putative armadillo-like helical protein [Plasmopara halstedii]